jgi:hypothetical protein
MAAAGDRPADRAAFAVRHHFSLFSLASSRAVERFPRYFNTLTEKTHD